MVCFCMLRKLLTAVIVTLQHRFNTKELYEYYSNISILQKVAVDMVL